MIYTNSIFMILLCFGFVCLTIYLANRRILSLSSGLIWIIFWTIAGVLSIYRTPLHKIMSYLDMINFTNFLLICIFFLLTNFIYILFVLSRKQKMQIEKLTQEISLLNFKFIYQHQDGSWK